MSLLVAEKLEKSPKVIDAGASFIWAHNNDGNLEQTSRLFARMIAKEIGMEEVARKEDLVQHDMARFYAEPDPHEGETVANAPECIILSLGWREKVMGIALQGLSSPVVVITLTTACSERLERLGVEPFDRMDTGTLSVLATAQICYQFYAEPDPHEGEAVANAPECIILSLGWRDKVMDIALPGLSSPVVVITLTTACSERFSSWWIKGVFRGYPTTWYLSLVERLGVEPFDRMDTGTLSVLATAQICYQ
ncbi:hypothetical protein F4703DRAFT_1940387 [Phycomyces blakesleeanus]